MIDYDYFKAYLQSKLNSSEYFTEEEYNFLYNGLVDSLGNDFTESKLNYYVDAFPDEFAVALGYEDEDDLISQRKAI